MAGRAKPTLRCLREDLALPVPRADTPLEEISHPLLAEATERFVDDKTPHEQIAAIDDEVLLKVKAQRWRNATARPFRWTKTADQIIDRICRCCSRISGPGHWLGAVAEAKADRSPRESGWSAPPGRRGPRRSCPHR